MKFTKCLFSYLLLIFLIASCQNTLKSNYKQSVDINISQGKTAITGFIVKGKNSEPVEGTVVRLGEVIWNNDKSDGSFIIDGANSPSTITDQNGLFIFNNIEKKDYVIVIGNLEEAPIIVVQKENKEKAEIYSPELNKELFVGLLNLDDY